MLGVLQLITPAGIGLAIAKNFIKQGHVVFANGRSVERLQKAFAGLTQSERERVM